MTMKAPTNAAEKDALIAAAATLGIEVTRTSKDFFLHDGEAQTRVTPGQIIVLIEEAAFEATERAAAFETAEAIRAEVEMGETAGVEVALPPASVSTVVDTSAAKPAKAVIKYGPPCGGQIEQVSIVSLPESANPLMHLDFQPATTFDNKEQARDHGRSTCVAGYLTFMAQHSDQRFWVAACVRADGSLEVDGQVFTLTLLTGSEAAAARAKVQGARWQNKHQFQAIAV